MVTPWDKRPAEVRLMILEMLLTDSEPREPRQLSKLATVCKDWQDLFEKENWKRLCLTSACIVDFDRLVVGRRRRYLQNIWIRAHIQDLMSRTPGMPSSVIDLSRMLLSLSTWDEGDAPSSLMVVYSAHETMEPFDPRVNVQKHIYSEPGRNEGFDLGFICDVLKLQSAHQIAEWCEKRGLPVITADEELNASIVSRYTPAPAAMSRLVLNPFPHIMFVNVLSNMRKNTMDKENRQGRWGPCPEDPPPDYKPCGTCLTQ